MVSWLLSKGNWLVVQTFSFSLLLLLSCLLNSSSLMKSLHGFVRSSGFKSSEVQLVLSSPLLSHELSQNLEGRAKTFSSLVKTILTPTVICQDLSHWRLFYSWHIHPRLWYFGRICRPSQPLWHNHPAPCLPQLDRAVDRTVSTTVLTLTYVPLFVLHCGT